jgi:hypothetical protein
LVPASEFEEDGAKKRRRLSAQARRQVSSAAFCSGVMVRQRASSVASGSTRTAAGGTSRFSSLSRRDSLTASAIAAATKASLYRSHPPLRIGVQIRTVGWQHERLDLARLDDPSERLGVFRVPIMQEIATVSKGAPSLHGRVPRHLLHPLLVRVDGDPAMSTLRLSRWMKNST